MPKNMEEIKIWIQFIEQTMNGIKAWIMSHDSKSTQEKYRKSKEQPVGIKNGFEKDCQRASNLQKTHKKFGLYNHSQKNLEKEQKIYDHSLQYESQQRSTVKRRTNIRIPARHENQKSHRIRHNSSHSWHFNKTLSRIEDSELNDEINQAYIDSSSPIFNQKVESLIESPFLDSEQKPKGKISLKQCQQNQTEIDTFYYTKTQKYGKSISKIAKKEERDTRGQITQFEDQDVDVEQ